MEPSVATIIKPTLTGSAQAVFRRLIAEGAATRPQIGQSLGLSRPTMSAAIAELERLGYVEMVGAVQGPLGRTAAQYRVGCDAGHVMAVDAGSSHIRLRVSTLDRRLLFSSVLRLPSSQPRINIEVSRAVAAEIAVALGKSQPEWGPLRTLGIAVPTRVVGPNGDIAASREQVVFEAFQPPVEALVVLENNVNCAAVAERHYGAAQNEPSFAYVQIGLKIGMGLILGDQLVRGRNGAAGEIGHLSFPFAPGLSPIAGEAEQYLGTKALMARIQADWPRDASPVPVDTAELVQRAEAGDPDALRHIERHARDIGAIVASCASVVDPGLIVLGGGLGAAPVLLNDVRETANRLSYAVDVRQSTLGLDATVLGIERLAIEATEASLLGKTG